MSRLIIAGLGNPGQKYINTRHNAGFMVLDHLADLNNISFQKKRSDGAEYDSAEFRSGGDTILLVKPLTFMNRSGQAVAPLVRFYRLSSDNLLVVHDDLDLDAGRMKFTAGGGAGGHNGIKSIITSLGTKDFPRLKIGIGRPETPIPVDRYVLSSFNKDEQPLFDHVVEDASRGIEVWVRDGIDRAMNLCNRKA